ncbi:MAG: hypothetical protein ACLU4N_08075 [Butyricimonas faecihominis]
MEKRYLYRLLFMCMSSVLWACNGYLEEIPQNKQKLSTTEDYEQLLNNAYLTKSVLPYIDVLTDDMDYIVADQTLLCEFQTPIWGRICGTIV